MQICTFTGVNKTGTDIRNARLLLEEDDLVAIPTETVYGLAANALSPLAVAKVFEAKQRPHFDPLIIHTDTLDKVRQYVTDIPLVLLKLAQQYWPGPLTLLLPKQAIVPDLVTSGLDQVAVRIPNHPLTLELLAELDFPLAAPSANPFGYISPTTAEHVYKQLGEKVDYILDGGPCAVGLESTIVGVENGVTCIYRLGGLSVNDIEAVAGKVELRINQSSDPKAPGQLKSHYAPRKPLVLGDLRALDQQHADDKTGIICFGGFETINGQALVKNLSAKKDYKEAAANLFSALRDLDESDCGLIIAELLPAEYLGIAINDRLSRAATRE